MLARSSAAGQPIRPAHTHSGAHAMTIIARTWTAIRAVAVALPALSALLIASPAPGQAPLVEREFDEKWMVVTSDRVNLRCGSGSPWYAVMQVDQGQLLRADGEDYGWIRVRYPDNGPALVRAREAELDAEAGVVTLTTPSPLRALNIAGGVQTCWRQLLERPLPAGTALRYVETRTDDSGETGYVVIAPEGAKGFIAQQFLRDATDAEIAAHLAQAGDAGAPEPAPERQPETAPPARAEAEQPQEQTQTAAQPEPAPVEEQPAEEAPVETTAQTPAEPDAGLEPEPGLSPETAPAETPETGAADAAASRERPTLEALNEAFERVMKQSTEQAELETLIGEYESLAETLTGSETDRARAQAIDTRVELLRLRLDVQRRLQRIAQVEAMADENTGRVRQVISALDPTYTAVGRLSVSAIYDGGRLPLMFRLVSVETGPARTIAYITPESGVDVRSRIGAVVGVVGERVERSTLKLPLIRPTRIDVIATPYEAEAGERP